MKREEAVGWSFRGALILGIAAGAAAGACSAGGGNDKTGPLGTGSTSGSGSTTGNGGGGSGNGGDGAGAVINTSGGTTGTGSTSGSGGGTSSIVTTCPPPIDRCPDTSAFAGAAPGSQKLLYPYDGTIFPRGVGAPALQWEGGTADAVMLEMHSRNFSYRECFPAQPNLRLQIPQDAWDAQGACAEGPGDPVSVTTTVVGGGQKSTINSTISFALATIKGALYYNTYDSAMTNHAGGVMKITPGAPQNPTVFLADPAGAAPLGPCYSCHALSANGSVMTANRHSYVPLAAQYESHSFDITSGTPVETFNNLPEAGFAGIFRDGSVLMTNGPLNVSRSGFFPDAAGQPVALIGPATSRLLDTKTGQIVQAPGWDVQHANMPMFSPDGKHMVYNDQDQGGGHSLWVIDFDITARSFSNKRQIFSDGTLYPGWPFFTPDSLQVVFALGNKDDFSSQIPDLNLPTIAPNSVVGQSHLMIIDLGTGQTSPLDLANGYRNGASYLPKNDNNLEFYPTMSPVAAGGFYWVFFTSRRSFGNTWAIDPFDPKSKKIWCTAISIGAPAGTDPSHPAFLWPGQEIDTGNMRAFAALEPCKEDGSQCSSGTECCSGYCTNINAQTGIGICGKIDVNQCAKLDDACTTTADCCTGPDNGADGRDLKCLGGFCGEVIQ